MGENKVLARKPVGETAKNDVPLQGINAALVVAGSPRGINAVIHCPEYKLDVDYEIEHIDNEDGVRVTSTMTLNLPYSRQTIYLTTRYDKCEDGKMGRIVSKQVQSGLGDIEYASLAIEDNCIGEQVIAANLQAISGSYKDNYVSVLLPGWEVRFCLSSEAYVFARTGCFEKELSLKELSLKESVQ